jgi:hypothetical protein
MVVAACTLRAQPISEWAFGGADHRLHYRIDERGNGIMDFSFAGYRGGGASIPAGTVSQRLGPAPGDNTARIQEALDKAAGVVSLAAGEYDLAGTLSITRSGVVLRGEKGASIRLTGKPHRFLEIRGVGTWREEGATIPVLDTYVPSGSHTLRVRDASAFHEGDRVMLLRNATAEWTRFMGMSPPSGTDRVMRTDRIVDSVEGDRIIVDAPLNDALDSRFGTAFLVRYSFPGRITEAGVEGLRITSAFDPLTTAQPQSAVLLMDAVEDGWARDLEIQDAPDGIAIGPLAKRLTLANIRITHAAARSGADATAADFTLQGTQILLDRCRVTGEDAQPVATVSEAAGPLVLLDFSADHGGVAAGPSWSTGLLVDGGHFAGATLERPGVAFSRPDPMRSGTSGGLGWAVAWNVTSPFLLAQQPPGGINWCIGCIGSPVTTEGVPNGIFDSLGKMVHPSSLYLQQLRDRLGPEALRNIGYGDRAARLL